MFDCWIFGVVFVVLVFVFFVCFMFGNNELVFLEGFFGFCLFLLFNLLGGGNEVLVEGIGVNGYLWCVSLDMISFMLLVEVDLFGGVIIMDWYVNFDMIIECFKFIVYIFDMCLCVDVLVVNVFCQVCEENGGWIDVEVSIEIVYEIENFILIWVCQL